MTSTEAQSRRHRLAAAAAAHRPALDGLLVSSRANVRYLSGFSGSNGWLLLGGDDDAEPVLLTDGRYREQATAEARGCRVEICDRGLVERLAGLLPAGGRLGFESEHVSHAAFGDLCGHCGRTTWEPTRGLVERLRTRKTTVEIDAIRAALALAETVLEVVAADAVPGITEAELAAEIDFRCRRGGAQRMAFDTIVAGGAHGALPHATASGVSIPTGSPVVVDMGCELDGYCSDITRCVVIGDGLDAEWKAVHGAVSAARAAAIAAIAPGVATAMVDRAAREVLAAAGLERAFVHGLGHGVGLEVHEAPRLSSRGDEVLAEGMVVTVEPGVYLPGRGGVRLEDMVVVREHGAERLNRLADAPLVAATG